MALHVQRYVIFTARCNNNNNNNGTNNKIITIMIKIVDVVFLSKWRRLYL